MSSFSLLVLPARSSRPVRAERRGTGGGHPVRGSCAVTHPCLPVTPADRPAGGVTAPSRLTRVVNGGWLPQAGGQSGTLEPRLLLRIGTASCSSQAPPADQPVTTGPKAPAITPATGRSPATTMPSSPRPAVQRHSGGSRHITRRAPAPASRPGSAVRRTWPRRPSRPRRRRCCGPPSSPHL